MKTTTVALAAFINGARQALMFDLWTIALQSGTVLRWTDADVDVTAPAIPGGRPATLFTRGPVIMRDRVKWVRGIEVDQLTLELKSPTQLIDSQPLPAFATLGGFDSAVIQLERVYLNDAGVVQGMLVWFTGTVSDVDPTDMGAKIVVKSQLTQLAQQLPRNLYQAGCLNNLYDANCGVNRAALTSSSTVSAVLSATGFNGASTGAQASGYYDLGVVKFTTGANAGIARTVLSHQGAALYFSRPFPFPVVAGDAFTVVPGCNKLFSTCGAKFANTARFRGLPFVPVPETVT